MKPELSVLNKKRNQMAQGCAGESRYNWNMGKSPKQQATQLQLGRNARPAWQPKVCNSMGHGNMGITSRDTSEAMKKTGKHVCTCKSRTWKS